MGVTSLSRDGIVANQKYSSALAGNDTADVALSSDFLIQEVVLNGTAASVVFDVSSLASTYKHLQIRLLARSSYASGNDSVAARFNNDSGSNYVDHYLVGNGSSVSSGYDAAATRAGFGSIASANATANVFTPIIIDFIDAFSTSKNKTIRTMRGGTDTIGQIMLLSTLWMSTSAITSINFYTPQSANFLTGSRFSLYGSKG